jgi:membrane-associated protease RseP (regulator of RpoE activity)
MYRYQKRYHRAFQTLGRRLKSEDGVPDSRNVALGSNVRASHADRPHGESRPQPGRNAGRRLVVRGRSKWPEGLQQNRIGDLSGETHEGGCLVTAVVPGSAAETAGLQVGDLITSLDGEAVADMRRLIQGVRRKLVGQEVVVEFVRGGKAERVTAGLKTSRE